MDAAGVDRLARALGYDYVYYPSAFHPRGGKDFGNGVMVRGRILSDHKLLLPHPSRSRGLQRIAVAADVEVGGRRLRVYSVHLETPAEIWPWQRREQMAAVLADAAGAGDGVPVVIAGDFNDRDVVGPMLEGAGFTWVSRQARRTVGPFAWDHVFTRGLPEAAARSGVVRDNYRASDHRPVWAELHPHS
jgi:endonuclease/exonuclease/phosphatase family metal-dependent hydrolase